MNGLKRKSLLLRSMVVLAVSAVASMASAQIHGAIYDTNRDGTIVNANGYEDCYDVYLNGGPQGNSARGLPEGEYYYMVTDPNGSVKLSGDDVRNRRLRVSSAGRIDGPLPDPDDPVTYPGHFESAGPQYAPTWDPDHNLDAFPNPDNGTTGVHLWPFAETPNPGGVYKVWLIPVDEYDAANADNPAEQFGFKSANQKTDNFKCLQGPGEIPPSSFLFGMKFYDSNHSGDRDPGEPPLLGWEIRIVGTLGGQAVDYSVFTDVNGEFSAELDEGTNFEICEVIPTADPEWFQSHPSVGELSPGGDATADGDQCWTGTVGEGDIQGLDFGNYRRATFSGHKFYDANVNGLDDDGQSVAGIRINVFVDDVLYDPLNQGYTTVTDANGDWTIVVNLDYDAESYSFRVEEVIPGTGEPNCYWMQTYPASGNYEVTVSSDDLDFGNVCVCNESNGRTLGFWSNKNGKAILDANPAWLAFLNGQPLRNASGTDVSFSNYAAFRSWLLNGTAVNMAYMLSVQLAASELNVAYNGLANDHELILPGHLAECWGSPTANLADVHAAALASLALYGYTPDGHAQREYQECLKSILDMSNNNLLPYIHNGQCDVVYP